MVQRSLAATDQSAFWLDDAGARATYDPLTASTRADLTIVGGGYLGLWAAVHAKGRDPGCRVVLLEGQTVGWAASGRNGGFCEASLTWSPPTTSCWPPTCGGRCCAATGW